MALLERAQDVAHKIVATALMGISLGGLTFIGLGAVDSLQRYYQRKALVQATEKAREGNGE